MPTFSTEILQNYISAFRESFAFIVQALRGFIDVIRSSPLYYMPLIFFLLLGMVFMIVWLIQTVSMNIGNTKYNVNAYANCNRLYSDGIKSYMNPWAFYAGRKYSQYKKRKEREDELARRAYEKIADEQEKRQFKESQYQQHRVMAEKYFLHNPNRMKVNIDGDMFYNGDDWFNYRWTPKGKMKHTTFYVYDETTKKYVAVKTSHTTTEVEDN